MASIHPPAPPPQLPRRRVSTTLRGLMFLGCGALAALNGVLFGQRELLEVGLLLLLLPMIALGLLAWRGVSLHVTRPQLLQRCFVGQTHDLSVQVSPGPSPTRRNASLIVEEVIPAALGRSPRFRITPSSSQLLTYPIYPHRRGRYHAGPLTTYLSDPLGLWELTWRFPGTTTALVAPRLVELPELALYGRFPVGMRTSVSVWNTEDDVSVRDYRHGDSQRRIHWRASARKGELMVRREEQPEQGNATLLLDDSEAAHLASGVLSTRGGGPATLPSFEQAVSVTASLAVALTTAGFGVNLRTRSGQSVGDVRIDEAGPLLDVLSEISLTSPRQTSKAGVMPGFGAAHASSDSSGVVIAVLGQVDGALLHELSAWPSRGRRALAILMGQAFEPTQAPPMSPSGQRTPSQSADQALSATLCQEQLSTAGWKVLTIDSLQELADAWMGVAPGSRAIQPEQVSA